MDLVIKHSENEGKFFATVNGTECNLKYVKWNDKFWDFISAAVPGHISDAKNLATKMVEHALEFAKSQNVKIKASCSWVQDFLVEHKEYRALIYYPYETMKSV